MNPFKKFIEDRKHASFKTFKEAEEYLNTRSSGHGRILCTCGAYMRGCRCLHGNSLPPVYVENGCENCGGPGNGWNKLIKPTK
jgi:hypothetical protein